MKYFKLALPKFKEHYTTKELKSREHSEHTYGTFVNVQAFTLTFPVSFFLHFLLNIWL